jgi:hypothetical protein
MAKILPAISLGVITIFAILFLSGAGNDKNDIFSQTFEIDALYHDGTVTISFYDKSENTDSVVMEILGMDETFQKTYIGFEFTESVPIDIPKYGWAIHPIVLEIEHSEFGHIQLKTEIHEFDESLPPVIFSQP